MNILQFVQFFYFLLQISSSRSLLTDIELTITLNLVERLGIRQCVYTGDNIIGSKIVQIVKKFSEARTLFTYLPYWQANDFTLHQTSYAKTGIIFKENAILYLRNMTQIYIQSNESYIMSKYTWLVFIENLQQRPVLAGENFNIPYDCEFILVDEVQENYYKIEEIYNIKNNGFDILFATWNQGSGVKVINEDNFYSRRIDFHGINLTETVQKIHENLFATAITRDVIFMLGRAMNFRFYPKFVELKNPVTESITKFYDGDFYNEHQTYNQKGTKIGPLEKHELAWYIKKPRNVLLPDYYLRPFDTFVWTALLFSIISATLLSLIIDYYIGDKFKRNQIDDLYMGVEFLCNQCGNDYVQTVSLRMVFFVMQVTIMVLMSAYGAVITSFLTVDKPELPFQNPKEFLENGRYQLGMEIGTGEHAMLQAYGNGFLKDDLLKKIHNHHTVAFDEVNDTSFFESFCSGNLAVLDFKIRFNENRIRCNFFQIPQPLTSFSRAIFLDNNSPFVEAFQIILLRNYIEAGIRSVHQKLADKGGYVRVDVLKDTDLFYQSSAMRKLSPLDYNDEHRDESNFYSVEFSQVSQVYLITVNGFLLAVLILVCELITKTLEKKRSQGQFIQSTSRPAWPEKRN